MTGKNERRYTVYATVEREGEYRIELDLGDFGTYSEAYDYADEMADKQRLKVNFERVELFDNDLRECVAIWEL